MAGLFELSKSSDGQHRFVLKANDSETILASELYHAKSSAENGIASVQANSSLEERYERKPPRTASSISTSRPQTIR